MLIHDDIFSWQGFGGLFHLAAGKCRLRIMDLNKGSQPNVTHIKPIVVIVSDLPDDSPKINKISVRSCCGHIATCVAQKFHIDPHKMVFVEYTPSSTYGDRNQHTIEAKYELTDFAWHDDKALHPKWRALTQPLKGLVEQAIRQSEAGTS